MSGFWQGAGSAIVSGVGGLLGGLFGNKSKSSDRKWQEQMQQGQNDWQSAENEKDRMWQQNEWLRQFMMQNEEYAKRFGMENAEYAKRFGMENEEWERRFNKENLYNSPEQTISRLQAAGINPAAALGMMSGTGGLAAAGGSSSPTNPSQPSTAMGSPTMAGAHAVTPFGLSPVGTSSSIRDILEGVSAISNSVSQSKKVGLDASYQKATLDSVVKHLESDISYKDALTTWQNLQNGITEAFGKDKAGADLLEKLANASLLMFKGEESKANKLLTEATTDLTNAKSKQVKESLPLLLEQIKQYTNYLESSAGKAQAETKTIDQSRPYVIEGLKLDNVNKDLLNQFQETSNFINTLDKNVAVNTYSARLDAEFNKYEREGLLNKSLSESIKGLIKENKFKEASMMMQLILQGTQSFENVTEGVGNTIRVGASMRVPKAIGFGK